MGKEPGLLSLHSFLSFLQLSGPNFIIKIRYLAETIHTWHWDVLAFPLAHESIQSQPQEMMAQCGSMARSYLPLPSCQMWIS